MAKVRGKVEWTSKFKMIKSLGPDIPFTSLSGFIESLKGSKINSYIKVGERNTRSVLYLSMHGRFKKMFVHEAKFSFTDGHNLTAFELSGDLKLVKKVKELLIKYLERMKKEGKVSEYSFS